MSTQPAPHLSDASDAAALSAHVEAVVRRSGTSFFWAMRLLPPAKRAGMFAVYAFCREVDDIADGDAPEAAKRAALSRWRDEIAAVYGGGAPAEPVARALPAHVARFGLRRDDFLAVIDGMEMDAGAAVRLGDMDELTLYCDRVACAVGRLSTRVFGVDDDLGHPVAAAQGQALQLTNILRDIREDAGRDRLYLPLDLLARHGVDTAGADRDLGAVLADPNLGAACAELAAEAGRRFAEAEAALARCDPAKMRPAVMMMAVYRRLFDRLQRRGWDRPLQPVALSAAEKLMIMLRYGVLGG
ncbi:MAG: presqualene diphosphate synthase HpnD [Hyphomicrobiales bacterium]|nr:presqualene diphosphate synthase HpnD [Hyphomicrobiales bacterium]